MTRKSIGASEVLKSLPKGQQKLVDELVSETETNQDLIEFAKAHADEFRLMLYNVQQLAKTLFRLQVLKGVTSPENAYEKIRILEDEILGELLKRL